MSRHKYGVREVEERVKRDRDTSRQSDLCLAHVGQRLLEMLWRSCGMARGQLAGVSKHKSGRKRYTTMEEEGQIQKRSSQINSALYFP